MRPDELERRFLPRGESSVPDVLLRPRRLRRFATTDVEPGGPAPAALVGEPAVRHPQEAAVVVPEGHRVLAGRPRSLAGAAGPPVRVARLGQVPQGSPVLEPQVAGENEHRRGAVQACRAPRARQAPDVGGRYAHEGVIGPVGRDDEPGPFEAERERRVEATELNGASPPVEGEGAPEARRLERCGPLGGALEAVEGQARAEEHLARGREPRPGDSKVPSGCVEKARAKG